MHKFLGIKSLNIALEGIVFTCGEGVRFSCDSFTISTSFVHVNFVSANQVLFFSR